MAIATKAHRPAWATLQHIAVPGSGLSDIRQIGIDTTKRLQMPIATNDSEDADGASVADALLTNTPPRRDLELETLAGALRGDILVHMHCYRADEMLTILDMAEEFGYRVGTFHHGVEAYKVADELAENGVCGALWADWWGFKIEAYDGIQENIALVDRPEGGCAIVHSDSDEGIQRLNQEAAKAMTRGNRAGLDIPRSAPSAGLPPTRPNLSASMGYGHSGTRKNGRCRGLESGSFFGLRQTFASLYRWHTAL